MVVEPSCISRLVDVLEILFIGEVFDTIDTVNSCCKPFMIRFVVGALYVRSNLRSLIVGH
ncbi:hypothetical protein D3C81_1849360 [compost metagenome]